MASVKTVEMVIKVEMYAQCALKKRVTLAANFSSSVDKCTVMES